MQLPNVDRPSPLRPASADAVAAVANRVIPVAPVNPAVHASPPLEPAPSVVNHVNPALQSNRSPNEGEPVYTSVPDPTRASGQAPPHDWTIHRPAPEKPQDPPPKPMSQILMEHLRSVWNAGASAIQVEQVSNQLAVPAAQPPQQQPGELAKQVLTYQPSKIKKTENL
jgi:hypothetical protein